MRVFEIEGIKVELKRKRVKNFNLTVRSPHGEVKLTYPYRATKQDYETFIQSRIPWIKKQQNKFKNLTVPAPLEYITGEKVWFLGKEFELIVKMSPKRLVEITEDEIHLAVLKTDTKKEKQKLLNEFYRKELYKLLNPMVKKWEPIMQVTVQETRIKNMKTLWGSCNIKAQRIWLNLELAKYDIDCIEYIVVHEMVHLLERLHSPRFYRFMDDYLPDWRHRKTLLN